jgi:thymidylate synthase (FAD)
MAKCRRQVPDGQGETAQPWQKYATNRFSRVNASEGRHYVTTNLRVLAENHWLDDLQRLTEPHPLHERRLTVHFTTQIGTTREFNRHRANSMAEQSTRYCNYGKAKFGSEIAVNLPVWVAQRAAEQGNGAPDYTADRLPELFAKVMDGTATDLENWAFANLAAERAYMNLTRQAASRRRQGPCCPSTPIPNWYTRLSSPTGSTSSTCGLSAPPVPPIPMPRCWPRH